MRTRKTLSWLLQVKFANDSYLIVLRLAWMFFLCQKSLCINEDMRGLVSISSKKITAFNNRNLTIECHVDVNNRSFENEKPSFSLNGRMVLTFMTVPRELKPLHQIQSFLHCYDPNRTRCRAEFNFDLACLEDQMNQSYYYNHDSYIVEAACQVDDETVCSPKWTTRFPFDCYDLGQIKVINGRFSLFMFSLFDLVIAIFASTMEQIFIYLTIIMLSNNVSFKYI